MPADEVGAGIRNFLDQESLSRYQQQSLVIDSSFPGLSNNLWVGSQRQAGGPVVSSLKNLSSYQLALAESDRGHSGQPSRLQHELNSTQSDLRPEMAGSQLQNQSLIVYGYMQGRESFQTRQNEPNLLGLDTAPTGSSSLDSPMGNVPDFHKNNSLRLGSAESPINYDLIGGQQQFSGKHPGMIHPLPRQQPGMTDMQFLQQSAIMQELQRHQLPKSQFWLPEARQSNSANQPEDMAPNSNCLQYGASPAMQVSSGMFSPGQGQMCLMGVVPQQVDQSFYGISASNARGNAYQYSSVQMDKPLIQQVPASSHSFLDNQYDMFSDQVGLQDGTSVSGQCDQDNNVFGAMADQETSLENSTIQVSSSHNAASLDPVEEKILFGSDDSMWDILGKSSKVGSAMDGMKSLGGFPSQRSRIWSALMLSAVAETSSNDIGVQEQGSGLDLQNCEPPSWNMPASTAMNNIEIDPSKRSIKRFKGPPPDSSLEAQQVSSQSAEKLSYGSNALMRDAQVNHPLVPSGDSKNDSPHFSNSNNLAANIRREHSQISPQMSTSWFDQYGAIKNGKMLPVCDAQKIALMNATEKAFIVGRAFNSMHVHSSEHDAGPLDKVQQSSNFMPISTEYTSPHSLPPDITSQNSMVARAMKRKSMTFEFLPWHREVTQGSQRPQNISVAEVEWAHAANRLIEKVEDEPQIIEDWPPMLRSKRRLVLTTQLLQQLLRSPPRVILSADASKNCETLACFVSRSVLGDACSMAYIYLKVTQLPPLAMEACNLSEKQREQRNQSLVKAAEEFISIAKMLEDSLQRIGYGSMICFMLESGQESLDLGLKTGISGSREGVGHHSLCQVPWQGATRWTLKFFGQRYVIALPMPRNLPDRVQCLSL
ncbi:Detected protein of unknown function [Hibiscus syriacus]|uniref:Uncharacterized protein n=1 Tax=Hibiscus syriacus TaxID=106335 RepID=A0A6A3A7P1_HIBSY|nr:Detected protein of unknown function [Hibiscus syriacus]